jgi:hypothetical protein
MWTEVSSSVLQLKFATSLDPPPKRNPDRYVKKPFKVPVRESLSMFLYRVSNDRDAPCPEPMAYSFIYNCRSPQKGALKRNASTEPHVDGRPTYSGVRPGSPKEEENVTFSSFQ